MAGWAVLLRAQAGQLREPQIRHRSAYFITSSLPDPYNSIHFAPSMPDATDSKKSKPLTPKQKAFVLEWLVDKNGSKAAEKVGYSAKYSRQAAYDLLRNKRVQAEIDKMLEAHAMRASEAIARLTDWGRGTMGRFLKVNEQGLVVIDLHHEEAQQHLHLLKKVKQRRRTWLVGEVEHVEVTTEIELYDALGAVVEILKLHGRFAPQKVDHTTNGKDLPAGPPPNIYMPDNNRTPGLGGGLAPPVTD